MIRAILAVLAALAALPAAAQVAQNGGPIRTGEHNGFTRVVMAIDPATEWSLETAPGAATIFFPGRRIDFGTAGVFDRIPRTRVTAIASRVTALGTRVDVTVNCDCRITASFVAARHLALDVGDRTAASATESAASQPVPGSQSADAAAEAPVEPETVGPSDDAASAAEAQAERESTAVASAESVLLQQLSRAADQGLVLLAPDAAQPEPEPAPVQPAEPIEVIDAVAAEHAMHRETVAEEESGAPQAPAPKSATPADGLADLMLHEQIEAMTVFDRDNATLAAKRAARRAEEPDPCVSDDALDVGRWTNGLALHAQTPQLMRGIVGEFDRPEPRALRDLARLYIRFGFGAEAESLLEDFGAEFPDRPLLADLARTVEGRPVDPHGPLALDLACPGRHGLWLAIAGAAPAYHDAEHFATVQAAFADLPPDLRAVVGPTLILRLLDADRTAEARLIEVTLTRPGAPPTVELRFATALLLAAEGRTRDALANLSALAESNAYNGVDALIAMTRLALDEGLVVPERVLLDLRGAAVQQRGDPREAALRSLLVEALAQGGALADAVAEVRAASADLPDARERFAQLGQTVLGAAEPEHVGPGAYAETILDAADLIPATPDADATRAAIAARLIDVGLPNASLGVLAGPLSRGDVASRLIAARADLAVGDAQSSLANLDGLAGPDALTLRATALAREGQPKAAIALLAEAGADAQAQPYAWASGDWDRIDAGETDPERRAMARFMAAQTGEAAPTETAAPDLATLTPETAFDAPLPQLGEPSLAAARSMLAIAAPIGGFLGALLEGDGAEPTR